MIKWGIIGPGAIANAFVKEVNNSQGGKVVASVFLFSMSLITL